MTWPMVQACQLFPQTKRWHETLEFYSLSPPPSPLSSALYHVWRYCPLSSYQMFILP